MSFWNRLDYFLINVLPQKYFRSSLYKKIIENCQFKIGVDRKSKSEKDYLKISF